MLVRALVCTLILTVTALVDGGPVATAAPAGTEVSGAITTDTTWSADHSPYLLTDVVTVAPDATLTIEPGVEVVGGWLPGSDAAFFVVHGGLRAHGSHDAPVVLGLEVGTGTAGAWFGAPHGATTDDPVGSVDLEHVRIDGGSPFVWQGLGPSDTAPSGALADFRIVDSTALDAVPGRLDLPQRVQVERTALGRSDDQMVDVPIAGTDQQTVVVDDNRLRLVRLRCAGGSLAPRGNTFELYDHPVADQGSGIEVLPGCDVDARGNHWDGPLTEERIHDGHDDARLPVVDVSEPLAAPSPATPSLPPGPVHQLAVEPTVTGTEVRWAPAYDGGAPVSYTVEARPRYALEPAQTLEVTGTAVTLHGLDPTAAHRVTVTPHHAAGPGPAATSASFTPVEKSAPPDPPALTRTRIRRGVRLTWSPAATDAPAAITHWTYIVRRGRTADSPVIERGRVDRTRVTVRGLRGGRRYRVEVAGVSAIGAGAPAVRTFVAADVPGKVRRLRAAPRRRSVRLTWRRPAAHGSPIRRYRITVSRTGRVIRVPASRTRVRVRHLRPHRRYRFTVRAVNDFGAGPRARTHRIRPRR